MTSLFLSVVIPTYNRRDSLKVTLEGLSKQSYPNDRFEAVIVSDGSTDGTTEMVKLFSKDCPFKINFVQQENGGPSRARNRAITEAVGDVIVFLDDDVDPVSGFLESHAKWHEKDDKYVIIGPMSPDPARKYMEPTWIAWEHQKLARIYDMFQPGGSYEKETAGYVHFYSGNASLMRKWLVEIGGFDLRYTRQEDVELALRLRVQFLLNFMFDFDAIGIHRPSRTFQSWLKIPREYGRLDAQRVVDGNITYDTVLKNTKNRHPISSMCAKLASTGDSASAAVTLVLRSVSLVTSWLGLRAIALVCLSGLYNVTYITFFEHEYARLRLTDRQGDDGRSSIKTTV